MVQVLVFVASAIFCRVRKSGAGLVLSLRLDMRVNSVIPYQCGVAGRGSVAR